MQKKFQENCLHSGRMVIDSELELIKSAFQETAFGIVLLQDEIRGSKSTASDPTQRFDSNIERVKALIKPTGLTSGSDAAAEPVPWSETSFDGAGKKSKNRKLLMIVICCFSVFFAI